MDLGKGKDYYSSNFKFFNDSRCTRYCKGITEILCTLGTGKI